MSLSPPSSPRSTSNSHFPPWLPIIFFFTLLEGEQVMKPLLRPCLFHRTRPMYLQQNLACPLIIIVFFFVFFSFGSRCFVLAFFVAGELASPNSLIDIGGGKEADEELYVGSSTLPSTDRCCIATRKRLRDQRLLNQCELTGMVGVPMALPEVAGPSQDLSVSILQGCFRWLGIKDLQVMMMMMTVMIIIVVVGVRMMEPMLEDCSS